MAFGFWNAKRESLPAKPAIAGPRAGEVSGTFATLPPATVSPVDAEGAVETLASVLRNLGAHAFDLETADVGSIRRSFERWAEHVLVAAPIDAEPRSEGPPQRDWRAVRESVLSHRRREVQFVGKTLGSLREVLWSFVGIVNRAAAVDKQEGLLARERLAKLRTALESNDTEVIKREATRTASLFERALEAQGQRQSEQLAEFAANVRKLGEELEGAKREGAIDALTRVHNRACFDEFLNRTVDIAALFKSPALLVMVDVDHFKRVNDQFGHPGGDSVLKAVSDCLARTFPRRGDLVARYGGDEFAVVLKDAGPKDARVLVKRVVEAARALVVAHPAGPIKVTLSVGFAALEAGDTAESWLARADAALYEAKAEGRDRWAEAPLENASTSRRPSAGP